jgi:hypothetical protein
MKDEDSPNLCQPTYFTFELGKSALSGFEFLKNQQLKFEYFYLDKKILNLKLKLKTKQFKAK